MTYLPMHLQNQTAILDTFEVMITGTPLLFNDCKVLELTVFGCAMEDQRAFTDVPRQNTKAAKL